MTEIANPSAPAGGDPGGIEQFGYKQELKRTLKFGDLVIYGLIFMVPIAPSRMAMRDANSSRSAAVDGAGEGGEAMRRKRKPPAKRGCDVWQDTYL